MVGDHPTDREITAPSAPDTYPTNDPIHFRSLVPPNVGAAVVHCRAATHSVSSARAARRHGHARGAACGAKWRQLMWDVAVVRSRRWQSRWQGRDVTVSFLLVMRRRSPVRFRPKSSWHRWALRADPSRPEPVEQIPSELALRLLAIRHSSQGSVPRNESVNCTGPAAIAPSRTADRGIRRAQA